MGVAGAMRHFAARTRLQKIFATRFTVALAVALAVALTIAFCGPAGAEEHEWPQWRGPDRDGVWFEQGLIDRFPAESLTPRWRVNISSGYSGPTVADGRVFVTDRILEPEESERIHCFDWRTGGQLWSITYPCSYAGISYTAGPRAAMLVEQNRAYSLGAAGNLYCVAADSGEVLWKRDLRSEYEIRMPNWGIAAAPLIEDDLLIVQIGGKQACILALDKHSGEPRWQALDDDASYSAPVVIDQGERRVLVCWTGERVVGLAPASGELLWQYPFKPERWPIAIATPVVHADLVFCSEAEQGSLLLRTTEQPLGVEKVWHRRDEDGPALHALISTPLIIDRYIYGVDSNGILRCLDLKNGEQLWQDDTAVDTQKWATIHMVQNGDRVWMFNEHGELLITKLSPQGFDERSRAYLIDPTTDQLRRREGVTWAHPAYAYRHVFARNDKELVCVDLSSETTSSAAASSK
ncbi:outer membrane protein assembly factor BamB family protein [Candidatus Laterigemmans baculatus]|uniref:outer membrane protein assembly factor BamB family protein n=1 Tax=Candidatus Laterigemmans baculatus TaxID=2770505 RepID=UPI0013DC35DB|nr:PQQ-binding-like beta-propeller repeat protein [Candidatus Laterigemmans baculatus]